MQSNINYIFMDKNKLTRLLLMSAFMLCYLYFFQSKSPDPVTANLPAKEALIPLNALPIPNASMATPFTAALQGEEKFVIVENELFKILLSTKGGGLHKVMLKKYKGKEDAPLVLLDAQSSNMGFSFPVNGLLVQTQSLFFQTQANTHYRLSAAEQATVAFRLEITPSQYLEHIFQFSGDSYQIDYTWKAVGMEDYLKADDQVDFHWNMHMKSLEADKQADLSKSTINYYLSDHTFDHIKISTNLEKKKIREPLKWVAIKQRFFSSAIIADHPFPASSLRLEPLSASDDFTKLAKLSLKLSEQDKKSGCGKFTFFFGPNEYKDLQKVTKGFERNLPLGWTVVRWINQGLIMPLFTFLEKHCSNYGLIIFLLVIVIKLLLVPLSYKSFIAMAKLKLVKPALDNIKAQYGNNQQRAQMEQIALYRELGINPLSGCVPILLQMPILLAMFNFFPNAIALRQVSFLWAHDLSTYDNIITLPFSIPVYGSHVSLFTILMVLSTILYTWSSNQSSAPEGAMKRLSYMMPLIFMVVLNTFPAGLSFYYCVSNITTFLQQTMIKWFINEDRIKEKLVPRQTKTKLGGKGSLETRVTAVIQATKKKE